jgi:hypothetical protein
MKTKKAVKWTVKAKKEVRKDTETHRWLKADEIMWVGDEVYHPGCNEPYMIVAGWAGEPRHALFGGVARNAVRRAIK